MASVTADEEAELPTDAVADSEGILTVSTSGNEKTSEAPVEDDLYCFKGTLVFFQVKRRIFRVPTYRFTDESHFFAGMFRLPQSSTDDSSNVKGSTRKNPIMLPNNILQEDFRNFLKALYPLKITVRISLSKEEWISVLRLSTFWYFLKYREMAISELNSSKLLSPTDKILFGREFRIRSWVVDGFRDLILRSTTIDKDEALLISYETTFSLFRLRERRLKGEFTQAGSTIRAIEVALEFSAELSDILNDEAGYKVVEELSGFGFGVFGELIAAAAPAAEPELVPTGFWGSAVEPPDIVPLAIGSSTPIMKKKKTRG